MKAIDNTNFSNKRALIRVDFNVPLNGDLEVTDETRIKAALKTINKVLNDGGSVVLMSHLGRPKNGPEDKFSLKHILSKLSENLKQEVKFVSDCISAEAFEASKSLQASEVLLLENLRFYRHETAGDKNFAEQLSKHGDVYINDAFGTAHRAHASTTIVAEFFPENKMFGYLIEKELEAVGKVLSEGKKPVTAIVGGAKVSSKISILENLLPKVDNILIGGGMAYTFAKALGGSVGNSLCEEDFLDTAKKILESATAKGVKIYLPSDSVIADAFDKEANKKECNTQEIPDGWMGMDIGENAAKEYSDCLKSSATILWNGPMGVFEFDRFSQGTKSIADAVVAATKKGAFTLVGGGDSVAAVNKFGFASEVSHVSTGGGAMLEFLEGKTLPGIAAIS
jgi:phosphoglycerate kinase